MLADAYARHPERLPNGVSQLKAVPTAVWINPPTKRADVGESENTMTRESSEVAIVDPGAFSKADSARDRLEDPNLTFEERCMAAAQ